MDLREYIAALRKRWYLVAALTLVGTFFGVYQAESAEPQYRATSKAFVSLSRGANTQELVQGTTYTQSLVQSYVALATMPVVLDPVIQELHLPVSARALAGSITAATPLNTVIIEISATTSDAALAADISNAVAQHLSETITDLSPESGAAETVRVDVVAPAVPPSFPVSPNKRLLVLVGFIGGLVAGVALAVVRGLFDTRIRSGTDIGQVTDAALLGTIPVLRGRMGRAVTAIAPRSVASESYRRLQTNLQFLDASAPVQCIVMTSSVGGEGKSTTSINLALAIAEKDLRVLLVDADMRRPAIADYCNLEGSAGLTTILIGKAELHDVVQSWAQPTLDVLTLGEVPPNPSQLIGSRPMQMLLTRMREDYDFIVLDAPPLLPVADATILARLCDGAVVVANCQKVHRGQLSDALATLESVEARCLGVVANRVRATADESYYGHRVRNSLFGRFRANLASRRDRSARQPKTSAPDIPTLQPVPDSGRDE
ncbi:capsular exopolysaccharide family [Nocardioides terrae]|uniref:non-specific protein-tyrosine kinase n=1 Tax=Nocardioides terrae TaxID=574651 RepID=A0A1I1HU33_9ACTN|nr:polysaccharide biosynthesis tyrosine autokinase [Nocardioides terrae]SFC27305.1 capsular exopolysaccharide family [Nocardioides terrae]